MKKLLIAMLLVSSLGLGACETLKGAGRDVQNAGEALDEAVDD